MKRVIFRSLLPVMLAAILCLPACSFDITSIIAPSATPDQPEISETPVPEPTNLEPERFDEYLNSEFIEYLTSDTLTLHEKLQRPEDYGISDYEVSWGSLNAFPTDEEIQSDRQKIEEFQTFDREKLTPEQQESYDIIAYQNELFEKSLELYYYWDPFQGSNGYHAILPILLSEYEFSKEKDIEDYLTLCSQVGELFDALIQFEKDKSEKGLFMSDTLADDVISGCKSFLSKNSKKKVNVMITSFKERLDAADFVDSAGKESYITRNQEIFDNTIVPTYNKLIAEIKALKGTGKNDAGLAHFEKGKEYYAYNLKTLGFSKTPEELIVIFDNKMAESNGETGNIIGRNYSDIDLLYQSIVPTLSAEEAVKFFKNKTEADFPSLTQDITYQIKTIDKSLKDMTSPAFFMVPQLDNYKANTIYYDEDYAKDYPESIFFIMAHEGYPGHLLQTVGMLSGTLSDFRKTVYFKGYSEGWAQYTESYCYKYLEAREWVKRIKQLEGEYNSILSFRVDLGVNYQGWDLDKMTEYIKNNYMYAQYLEKADFKAIYNDAIKNPMVIAPYEVGKYEIETLKEHYKSSLGSEYSDKLFHEEFLKRGEAPFSLIREWMDKALLNDSNDQSLPDAA